MITFKKSIQEIQLKRITRHDYKAIKITSSKDARDFIYDKFPIDIGCQESAMAIYLNNANNTIAVSCISIGGITGTLIDLRIVMTQALLVGATSIIMVHNHPSGNLKASEADRQITKKLQDAGKILDIKLLDHLIVIPESNSFFSFADECLL